MKGIEIGETTLLSMKCTFISCLWKFKSISVSQLVILER